MEEYERERKYFKHTKFTFNFLLEKERKKDESYKSFYYYLLLLYYFCGNGAFPHFSLFHFLKEKVKICQLAQVVDFFVALSSKKSGIYFFMGN